VSYFPTPGPLPGDQFIPSSSDDGIYILTEFCQHCARDKAMREGADFDECDDDDLCEIIAAGYRKEAVEWREIDGIVTCIAFVPAGQPIPDPRCPHTLDMFASHSTPMSVRG